jgi:ParB-like chromosome segregation protein Spo0J
VIKTDIVGQTEAILKELDDLPVDERVEEINRMRKLIHEHSPFKDEPVDCVLWVKNDSVQSNDYNPNVVAPPEMKLLEISIKEDGYTQPIVAWDNDESYTVVDGFHRNRVGKESKAVRERVKGYLPVSLINPDKTDKDARIASTIRHNRARGKHTVAGMSDVVLELKNRNRSNEWIALKLGMDEDEILRLCQITGLASLFNNQEFSKSWDIEDSTPEFTDVTEDMIESVDEVKHRTVNTSDPQRIFHTYDTWECYKAGFYNTTKPGMTKKQCEEVYRDFLADLIQFSEALEHIITEWQHSCEHYLTNTEMNRIAWLGQAALCYAKGIPAAYRGGFNLLTDQQQKEANGVALEYLNKWLKANGREEVTMEIGLSDNQMELY